MNELFSTWGDEGRICIGQSMLEILEGGGATGFHVGPVGGPPYRNEVRVGWREESGSRARLLGILRPCREGVRLELRVGRGESASLIRDYPFIRPATDGSSNTADKVVIFVTSLPLPPQFQEWVQTAYESVGC